MVKLSPRKKTTTKKIISQPIVAHPLDIYELASDKLFEVILHTAITESAKAVHFEYTQNGGAVRLRYHGKLHNVYNFDRAHFVALLKYVSDYFGFDVQYKLPQLNRTEYCLLEKRIHLNASLVKLDNFESRLVISLEPEFDKRVKNLGFSKYNQGLIEKYLEKKVLATVVAGKKPAVRKEYLFGIALENLSANRKVISIENYIGQHVSGIEQLQLRPEIGFMLETALRAAISQDFDVVIVEDVKTLVELDLALHLALSGREVYIGLALDGLNDVFRFVKHLELDLDLLFSTVGAVVVLRELQALCPKCGYQVKVSNETVKLVRQEFFNLPLAALKKHQKEVNTIWKTREAHGCGHCQGSGYQGIEVLSEVVMLNSKIKKTLKNNNGKLSLADLIDSKNLVTLRQDALIRAIEGRVGIQDSLSIDKYI